MMNGFILQENTSILISRNGKTLYSILHRSLDLTNRKVGKEVKNHFYLLENQINVDKILNKLINLGFLDIKSNFDVSFTLS